MRSPRFGDSARAPATTRSAASAGMSASGAAGRRGLDRLLHVDQREAAPALGLDDAHQGGVAQEAQGAAALHPVGGIDQAAPPTSSSRALQLQDEPAHRLLAEERRRGRPAPSSASAQNLLPERDGGLDVLEALVGEVLPAPAQRPTPDGADGVGLGRRRVLARWPRQPQRVAADHLLQHPRGGDARQVGAAGRAGERQAEPDEVVRGVADHGLVEVADLDVDAPVGVGERAEIAEVAVAADPDRRALRQGAARQSVQPFVELSRCCPAHRRGRTAPSSASAAAPAPPPARRDRSFSSRAFRPPARAPDRPQLAAPSNV